MLLYVCWGTFQTRKGHPCANAYEALIDAGYEPEVVKTGGCYRTDPAFPGRRKIRRLTGNYKVPTLVLDDETIVDGSEKIIEWAQENRARESGPDRAVLD